MIIITKPLLYDYTINQRTRLYDYNNKALRLDNFLKECQEAVENATLSYLTNLGKKLHNPNNSSHKFS